MQLHLSLLAISAETEGIMASHRCPVAGAAVAGGGTAASSLARQSAAARRCHARSVRHRSGAAAPRSAAAAAAAAAAQSAADDVDRAVYLDAAAQLKPFVGPIEAARIPGKGRGLVATAPLAAGQLLLVVPPIALIESDFGDIPEHDELAELLCESGLALGSWQAAWLAALMNSTDGDASSSSSSASAAADVPSLMPPVDEAATDGVQVSQLGLNQEQLWGAIVLNCYGEAFQDLPATLASGAAPNGQLGLFGPFSLLNHSCCPNAVNYTLRDCMVVRAAVPVAAGQELSINYLGRGSLRPLSQRQLELDASYGFACNCERCQLEQQLAGCAPAPGQQPLGVLLDEATAAVSSSYEPQLQQLLQVQYERQQQGGGGGGGGASATKQGLLQLAAAMQTQHAQLQEAVVAACAQGVGGGSHQAQAAAWTAASAFDLLGLLHEALSAAGQEAEAAEVRATMLAACQATCAGSDLHVFQAQRCASLEQQASGLGSPEEQAALRGLVAALRARYGAAVVEDAELLARMVDATAQAAALVSI